MSIKEVNTEKEPIPEVAPISNTPKQKPILKEVDYQYAGKETLGQIIGKAIPPQLIPTKRMGTIFGGIFIVVLIIAAFQFPLGSLMSGNIDFTIKIGFPWTFLELALKESDIQVVKPLGLFLDLLLYIILAYGIDVTLSLILKNPLLQSKKKIGEKPTIFKNKESSLAEKVVDKVVDKKPKPQNTSI